MLDLMLSNASIVRAFQAFRNGCPSTSRVLRRLKVTLLSMTYSYSTCA
jgi:hypothetical protein